MSLLDLLTAGKIEEFNASRGQRRRVDLFAADLAGAQLAGADLSNVTLEKADLTGANVSGANFAKSDLSGVDATEADFSGVTAVGAKMREAIADEIDLSDADLSHVDLTETSLQKACATRLRLSGAKLRATDLTGADLTGASFVEARLHQSKFVGATLVGADLTEVAGQECDFTGADLSGVVGVKARLGSGNFTNARLTRARLTECELEKADLTGADLTGADLRRANLAEAKLAGAKLAGADLSDAVLDRIDFTGVDLTGVVLAGVDPRTLGLTDAQIGGLAVAGAQAEPDAPWRFTDVSVAALGGVWAVLWENHDSEETLSLRWALAHDGGEIASGVLAVSADGVLARTIVPAAEGFLLVVLHERAGGAAIMTWHLSAAGVLGTPRTEPLGYEPGVKPVVRWSDGALRVWGLARRGPTLVVQKIDDTGVHVVASEKQSTARGFIPGPGAVLASKGGVVLSVGDEGVGHPLRTPAEYPSRQSVAVPVDDRVAAVWVEERQGDVLGGICTAWLSKGAVPKRRKIIETAAEIVAIDGMHEGDTAKIAWIEIGRRGTTVKYATMDGEITEVPLGGEEFEELRFAHCGECALPALALVDADEHLVIAALDGRVLATLGAGHDAAS